jgi:hypothetical protein
MKSKNMRWAEHVSHVEESISEFRVLFRKLERQRRIGEEEMGEVIIKWVLGGMELCVDWIQLTQDREKFLAE